MDKLIETLEGQHHAIRAFVTAVDRHLAAGDGAQARSELARLKVALLAHLDIEDAQLYPALTKAAAETRLDVPMRIAATYEKNMEGVSAAVRAFLDRYAERESKIDELRRDWRLVARMLVERMESEEEQLYPLYRSWVLDDNLR